MEEAEIALGGLVVTGGKAAPVLQLVETAFNPVPEGIDVAVDGDWGLPVSACWNDWLDASGGHRFPDGIGIVTPIRAQDLRLRSEGSHERQGASIIRGLPRGDVDSYGETGAVRAEMDLCRGVPSRAPKTLSWSPPLAPAALGCAQMMVESIISTVSPTSLISFRVCFALTESYGISETAWM